MRTLTAVYKGARLVELTEDVNLPENVKVLVVIPEQDDERVMQSQLQLAAEDAFGKLWDNEEDEVWREYL